MVHAAAASASPLATPLAKCLPRNWIGSDAFLRALRESDLASTPRHLLRALLADFADRRTGLVCPSAATLAAACGVDVRTAERWLPELRAAGWLVPMGRSARYGTNLHRLAVPGEVRVGGALILPILTATGTGAAPVYPENETESREQAPAEPPAPPAPERSHTGGSHGYGSRIPIAPAPSPPPSTAPACHPKGAEGGAASQGSVGPRDEGAPPAVREAPAPQPSSGERPVMAPRVVRTLNRPVEELLAAMRGSPDLSTIATPELAERLAKLRPLGAALAGVRELSDAAGDARAAGEPWPRDLLIRRARTFILGARWEAPVQRLAPELKAPTVPSEKPVTVDVSALAKGFENAIANLRTMGDTIRRKNIDGIDPIRPKNAHLRLVPLKPENG